MVRRKRKEEKKRGEEGEGRGQKRAEGRGEGRGEEWRRDCSEESAFRDNEVWLVSRQ